MAIKVLTYRQWKSGQRVVCDECKSRLQYDEEDVYWSSPLLEHYIECPECGVKIVVPDPEDVVKATL